MKFRFFSKLTCIIVAVLTFVSVQSCQTSSKPIEPSKLEGFWVLKSINGKDAKTVFTQALPTLTFDFKEMRIAGTGGCNSYTGGFTLENNILSSPNIASTQMMCLGDIPEHEFFGELGKTNTISMENGILRLTNTVNGTLSLEFEKGQAPAPKTDVIDPNLLSATWTLKKMDGQDAASIFAGENAIVPSLKFDVATGKMTGNAGCNVYNSSFTLEKNVLIVKPIVTTRKACPNLQGEMTYLKNLGEISDVSISSSGMLQISKNGNIILEFEKSVE